jgi:SPP1 gp7 family putative phage head morphogenesis protein
MGLLDLFIKKQAPAEKPGITESAKRLKSEAVVLDEVTEEYKEIANKAVQDYLKDTGGKLPVKGGQESQRAGGSLLDVLVANLVIENPDFHFEMLDTLYHLATFNEDFSYAVDNITQLGNTDYQIYFNDTLPKSMVEKCLEEIEKEGKNWYEGGVSGLIDDLLANTVISGAISSEIVPKKDLSGVEKAVIVPISEIRIAYNKLTKDYDYLQHSFKRGLQNKTPGYIKLNPITYKYYAYRKFKGSPYAIPSLLPALDGIKLDNEMICGLQNVIKRLGIFGFLEVVVNPPKPLPSEAGQAGKQRYYARCKAFLANEVIPEVEKGFNKGYIVGFKESHEFKMQSTSPQNMQGINSIIELITTKKHSGLKQDPMMLGRNQTTTETLGRVLLAKLGNQVRNYQKLVANFLSDLMYIHLNLKGYPVEFVKIEFAPAMIGDSEREARAYGLKLDNLGKLYEQGIIDQNQYAQEAGYEKPAEKEPKALPGVAKTKTGKQKDPTDGNTTEVDKNALEHSQIALGSFYPQFQYSSDCNCGVTHLELGFSDELEKLFQMYFAPVRRGWGKAVNELSLLIGREIGKMKTGTDTQKVVNTVLYLLNTRFNTAFTDKQKNSIDKWVTFIYAKFRKDNSIFKGKKNVPNSVFNQRDTRTIEFYKKNDALYLGKFITDKSTVKKITEFIKNEMVEGTLPIGAGGNKEALEAFRKKFGAVLKGEDWKIERVLRTTFTRMKNTASINYMAQAEVVSFERVEVMDRLTCPYCRQLNGKQFSVKNAVKRIEAVNSIEPGYIGAVDPFITSVFKKPEDLKGLSAEDIEKAGASFAIPHPNCRGTVVAVL